MYSMNATIKNVTGLHARPGSNFAMKAMAFKANITIARSNNSEATFNAKSLMKLLALGVTQGEEVIITANGEDEEEAVKALCDFINEGCGER